MKHEDKHAQLITPWLSCTFHTVTQSVWSCVCVLYLVSSGWENITSSAPKRCCRAARSSPGCEQRHKVNTAEPRHLSRGCKGLTKTTPGYGGMRGNALQSPAAHRTQQLGHTCRRPVSKNAMTGGKATDSSHSRHPGRGHFTSRPELLGCGRQVLNLPWRVFTLTFQQRSSEERQNL